LVKLRHGRRKVRALVAREQQGELLRIAITGGLQWAQLQDEVAREPRRGDILVRTADVDVVVDPKTRST